MPGKTLYQWKSMVNVSMFKSDWFWTIWRCTASSRRDFQIAKLDSQNWYKHYFSRSEWYTLSLCVYNTSKCQVDVILNANTWATIPTYQHYLAKIMCNPPHARYYLGRCDVCPGTEVLKEELLTYFVGTDDEQIIHKQWVSTDRSTLKTFTSSGICWYFLREVELLYPHSFIATEQASFYAARKATLKTAADFSENYSFVLQDAAQGFHWNNSQATMHPFVAYYLYYLDSGEACLLSYVVIYECMHHDTVAVHLFQKSFVTFLKDLLPARLHPIYLSGGAALQYKNRKNFLNLCHHKDDFGVKAEWHFQPLHMERGHVMVWAEQSST